MDSSQSHDDDTPQLSADTLSALKEFLSERDSHLKQFESLKSASEDEHASREPLSMAAFAEDWNASQFWYSEDTARKLASALLNGATKDSSVVFVSAPSAFIAAKNLVAQIDDDKRPRLVLLEYDDRFQVFSEFVHYDYNAPTKLPSELRGAFDRVICDPPFLSEECQTKAALTVRWLLKGWTDGMVVCVCTGERMENLVTKLYSKTGLKTTSFEVVHQKGLSNEFRCYANWESEFWSLKS